MRTMLAVATALALGSVLFVPSSAAYCPDNSLRGHYPRGNELIADVLIAIDINANSAFADLTPLYADAFMAAGASIIATCAVEDPGGTIEFPPDLTAWNYPIVCVLTSENFLQAPHNIDPADEAVLAGYLDTGGNLLLVGQDYMWGSHPDMGVCYGFPKDYLGMDFCWQDVAWAADWANISGSPGWIFEGKSYHLDPYSVFVSSPLFPDCADPVPQGGYALFYDDYMQDGIAIHHTTDTFKTFWSGCELAAASAAEFHEIIRMIYDWFFAATPARDTTWGRIKALYR